MPMNLRAPGSPAALVAVLTSWVGAQPKIEDSPLGPYAPNRTAPTVSKDGLHMALIVPKGSKSVITVDGGEGPRFDTLVNQIVFFPDGMRHACFASSGTDGILVLDGKEVAREPLMDNNPPCSELTFSPGGKRFAHTRRERETKGAFSWLVTVGHTPTESILLINGKAGSRAIQPDWRHSRQLQALPDNGVRRPHARSGDRRRRSGTRAVRQ